MLALAAGLAGLQVTAGDDGARGDAVRERRNVHIHGVALGRIGIEGRRTLRCIDRSDSPACSGTNVDEPASVAQ